MSAGLALLTVAVFAQVHSFGLVNWDDPTYISDNPQVRGGLSWTSVVWAWTTGHPPYWHPVTWMSHLLDFTLFGNDPGAFHLVSLALHIANALLVFHLFRRMTRAIWPSAFVAAIFAVHPLHVESVAWIAERKDVLSTFFWALAMLAYVRYTERPAARRYLAVCVLFALALAAKPMVVTLPVILLLMDVWPLMRMRSAGWRRLLLEKVPLSLLAGAAAIVTVLVQQRVGALARFDSLPLGARLAHAVVSYALYLGKVFWPAALSAFYPYHPHSPLAVAAAAFLLSAITVAALAERRRYPYLLFGWLWYLVTLLPVVGLLQSGEQAMADRFMYVPLIGLTVMVAWRVRDAAAHFRLAPRSIGVFACTVVLVCAIAAHAQAACWESSITLWTHAIEATPDSYIAYEDLAQAQRERGQLDAALANYRLAREHAPMGSPQYRAVIDNSMGLVLRDLGRDGEALEGFARAVSGNAEFAEAHSNLANALASARRFDDAVREYQTAARLEPGLVEAQLGLGNVLLTAGRPADAIPHYDAALRLDATLAEAHNGRGAALASIGRTVPAGEADRDDRNVAARLLRAALARRAAAGPIATRERERSGSAAAPGGRSRPPALAKPRRALLSPLPSLAAGRCAGARESRRRADGHGSHAGSAGRVPPGGAGRARRSRGAQELRPGAAQYRPPRRRAAADRSCAGHRPGRPRRPDAARPHRRGAGAARSASGASARS